MNTIKHIIITCTCYIGIVCVGCNGGRGKAKPMDGYKWCWVCDGHQKVASGENCLTCNGTGVLSNEQYEKTKESFKLYQKMQENNNAFHNQDASHSGPNSDSYPNEYSNNYYENYPPQQAETEVEEYSPRRVECQACHAKGECICVKNGHPGKELSALSIVTEDPVYETHRYCHGTGKCPACGGDGYLDEGVDY